MALNSNNLHVAVSNIDSSSDSYAYSDAVLAGGIQVSNAPLPTITNI